ncbi:MAG: beta-ketoacyl-ACP synthase II [Actinomycetota bacterium]
MRVFVTGIGVVTPIGIGRDALWSSLLERRSGAGPITAFEASEHPVRIACEVRDFTATDFIGARDAARMDRFSQMAVAAALQATDDAGVTIAEPDRAGVVVGSGIGGFATIEEQHSALLDGGPRRVSPFAIPRLMPNAAAGAISMTLGLTGLNYGVASACATGAHAIGEAVWALRAGRADVVFAGGTEATVTPLAVAAFARMGALSTRNDEPERASRPFDKGRDGFVLAEGAAVLVLETEASVAARDGHAIAEVLGYGATSDAYHVTQPDPEGRGAVRAMQGALEDAQRDPADIDYVNAHGTSTPYNDRIETIAIKEALGNEAKRIPVTSTKSQTGHLLGAAGALEAAVCALAIHHGAIPGTINLDEPDPDCDLDHVPDGPRSQEVRIALSNSFGFGGQNACLVLGAPS